MRKTPISLIHPLSNPNVRNTATALGEAGLLREIITTFAYNPESDWTHIFKYLPTVIADRLANELGRRTWIPPDGVNIRTHPWQEVWRMFLVKSGLCRCLGLKSQELVDWVYASLDRHVAQHHLDGLTVIYAYEDGAATTFQAAKQRGILCFYDLPTLFYRTVREIQQEEAIRFPELASVLQATREPVWKLRRKEKEIALADHIFVASSMTRRSLLQEGINSERITVIPYGAPIEYFHPQPKSDSTFRVLFVGRVSPCKGIHYLMQAWQTLQLPQSELMLVGFNEFPSEWFAQPPTVHYVPSVPHYQLNRYYSNANVFVFPSLLEGFGLVLLEAMACGIPVITTSNTAGPDILTDGVEGFIIPIRDPEAIRQKLEWCYHHPKELAEMGQAARCKAEQLSWKEYQQKLADQVQKLLGNRYRNQKVSIEAKHLQ